MAVVVVVVVVGHAVGDAVEAVALVALICRDPSCHELICRSIWWDVHSAKCHGGELSVDDCMSKIFQDFVKIVNKV